MGYNCFEIRVQIFLVAMILVQVSFVPIETLNILFESTQIMPQYGTKITCSDVRGKKLW